ncbi:MAG TPA: radical SAM protein, partial [Terriglobales bacterium]|nr:radical SAM protein [Terriglobales bacterium]
MMRVQLINPPPYQRVDRYDTPDFTRLGLACLAAKLRVDGFAQVDIVDAKFERLSYDAILERVRQYRPDVIGLTAFTNEIKPASQMAAMVKALSSQIHTVVGGVHATVLPERTLREFASFDSVVIGEGEIIFSETVAALAGGTPLEKVAGLCFRRDGDIVRTAERERPQNLDALPPPAWDLLPPSPRYLFMTQRGCAYRCTFCANPNGRVVRTRSVDNAIAELEQIISRGGEELYVCDELFTANRERTHRLLDAMISAGIGKRLRWSAQTHVNLVDRELFAK